MLATILVALGVVGCARHNEDKEVLGAALVYLVRQLDAQAIGTEGILLLRPMTRRWTQESIAGFSENPKDKCVIPQELYSALVGGAETEKLVDSLVSTNKLWRIGQEERRDQMPSFPPLEFDGVPVRTVVTVSSPGFSRAGDEALVLLSFTWSVHDALARIRMARNGGVWRAQCVQFNFYV
ncbi:hypothetical protein [Steroidobacter cummioxidans]|uniref:hypothetical protein n=1 Tax=Steroidobacter cummioxidans TaxID=1803913 RepID=UPI0012903E20|nr:hypothetical protein [Steroidobacter cummioxidans]